MKLRWVRRGRWALYAVCTDRGDCPLLEFLYEGVQVTSAGLIPRGAIAKEKVRMLARLDQVAQSGPPRNTSICHQIEEGIWQIETGRLRVLWFYDAGSVIILTQGFLKSTQKTPEFEKRLAREARRRYFEAKKANRLEILEDV